MRTSSLGPSCLAVCAAVGLCACGQSSRGSFDEPGSGGFVAPDAGPVKAPECAEATKNIFVLAEDRTIYSFYPPTREFTSKGPLNCPTDATPTSMAVDRDGTAWVRDTDGAVWRVSTTDLGCLATSYKPPAGSFRKFGMGFATDAKGGSAETLYLSDSNGAGLAKLDTGTLSLQVVGEYTGALKGSACELTGTGDGQLFGFFVTSPAQVAEINKSSGAIVSAKPLPNVYGGNAWAFSFYGGDFYIYTHSDGAGLPRATGGSDVTRYRPSDGSIEVVLSKIGFKIVGAGVSTCAPTTPTR